MPLAPAIKPARVLSRRRGLEASGISTKGQVLYLDGTTTGSGSARKLADLSGNVRHGAGLTGRALTFDGVADYAATGVNMTATVQGGALTVGFMANFDDGDPASNLRPWGVSEGATGALQGHLITALGLRTEVYDGTNTANSPLHALANGKTGWKRYICKMVQNGSAVDATSYLDTAASKLTNSTASVTMASFSTPTLGLNIGRRNNSGGYVPGEFSEFVIWNTALSDADMESWLTNPEHAISTSSMVMWYRFSEYANNPANDDPVWDYSGNGNHAKLPSAATAATLQETISQVCLQGWTKRALFDGVNDSAKNTSVAAPAYPITLIAWVSGVFTTSQQTLVGYFDNSTINDQIRILCGIAPTAFRLVIRDTANIQINGTTDYTTGKLFCVVGIARAANDFQLYVNGVSEGTSILTKTVTMANIDAIGVGEEADSNAGIRLHGVIHEAAITSGNETANIAAIYNSGTPPDLSDVITSNRIGYWRNTGDGTWTDLWGIKNLTVAGSPKEMVVAKGATVGRDAHGFTLQYARGAENSLVLDRLAGSRIDLSAHINDFRLLTQGTLVWWFKKIAETGEFVVLSFADNGAPGHYIKWSINANKVRFMVMVFSATDIDVSTNTTFADNTWHHAGVAVNADGNRIVVDGVQQAVTYTTGTAATRRWVKDVNPDIDVFDLGALAADPAPNYQAVAYEGNLGRLRMYDRALSNAELLAHFNAEKSIYGL